LKILLNKKSSSIVLAVRALELELRRTDMEIDNILSATCHILSTRNNKEQHSSVSF